jgi:dTDP-4-amino-4,6-dideoxygalactose transaminase
MKFSVADPNASYRLFSKENDGAELSVLRSGWYIRGQSCKKFEKAFAKFCTVPPYPALAHEQIDYVCASVRRVFDFKRK